MKVFLQLLVISLLYAKHNCMQRDIEQKIGEINTLLAWHRAMGVDECILERPINRLSQPSAPASPSADFAASIAPPGTQPKPQSPATANSVAPAATVGPTMPQASLSETLQAAKQAADSATTLPQLREALAAFEGCELKKTARNLVFADGASDSDIMLIGEAPGADEDQMGIPFCGASGQLLDKMLAAIGLDRRRNCYITNTLFWRPPGNRTPTPEELAICQPFVERHIQLFQPTLLICVGGTAAKSLLRENRGITRLRGKELHYQHPAMPQPIPAFVLFHPSYLLRQPIQKRLAWQDLQTIRRWLQQNDLDPA